jgi:predicted kinase
MPKCIMLVGVPGSGKSTWLKDGYTEGYEVISTDDIIDYVSFLYGMTYDEAFSDLIKFAEKAMWKQLETAAKLKQDIIIDRTNLTANSRRKFFRFLKGYTFEAIVFPTPDKQEWERRLNSRPGKTIPKRVLESMLFGMEMPTEEEGFSNICSMT